MYIPTQWFTTSKGPLGVIGEATQWFTTSEGPLGVIGEALFGLVRLSVCPNFRPLPASPILHLLTRFLEGITVLARRWLLQSDLEIYLKGQGQHKN